MKFRAKAVELAFIRTFSQLLSALSRCSRSFVLRITSDKLIFVLPDKDAANATSTVSIWGEIPQDPYFAEYAMEGVSPDQNEIFLEIYPDKIAACLSTLRSSLSVAGLKIKLTKKFIPCLTFEIEFNGTNTCAHDVPVSTVSRKLWNHYKDPFVPTFDISISMPELKLVRLAIERMKNLGGGRLNVKGSSDGRLQLSTGNYSVKCTTKFQDLRIFDIGDEGANDVHESEPEHDPDQIKECSVEVEMKTLVHMISTDLQKPSHFILSICDTRRLHLYFLFGDISLQFSVPSIGE